MKCLCAQLLALFYTGRNKEIQCSTSNHARHFSKASNLTWMWTYAKLTRFRTCANTLVRWGTHEKGQVHCSTVGKIHAGVGHGTAKKEEKKREGTRMIFSAWGSLREHTTTRQRFLGEAGANFAEISYQERFQLVILRGGRAISVIFGIQVS